MDVDQDALIRAEADNLFEELASTPEHRRPLPHMPSSSQFKRQTSLSFSTSQSSSLQRWYGEKNADEVASEAKEELDDDLVGDMPPNWESKKTKRRTSAQSAWSTSSSSSKGSRESNVWSRDSLFSFGPKETPQITDRDVADIADEGAVKGLQRKRVGFIDFTMRFVLDTAGHGMPRIVEKDIWLIRRIIWGCIVLGAAVGFIIQTHALVSKYLDKDFKVDVKYKFNKEIGFPAVTLCNLNPLNRSKLECSRFDTSVHKGALVCQQTASGNHTTVQVTLAQILQARINALLKSDLQQAKERAFQYNFTHQEAMTAAEIAKYGYDLSKLMVSCTFRGQPCGIENFTRFESARYGNCYTFNNNISTQIQISQPGPAFGLAIDLAYDPLEEIGLLSHGAGFQVAVHEPRSKVFPEEDGMSISPATATSIGIRQAVVERLGEPYGNCTNITGYDWGNLYSGYKYTRTICLKECFAQAMLDACGCVSENILVGKRLCLPATLNKTEADCRAEIEELYRIYKLPCLQCFNPCKERIYRTTVSTASWPSFEYQREFKQLLKQKGFQVDHFDVVRFRDQYARVEVFYEELNFENIVQKPAYEPENLLADMGGQLGLWLGFSVLAILEIIEYLIYMLLVALGKVKLPDEEDYLKARDD
eukprot:scpid49206/ scgid6888/ Amiloride-sensitive sodium channel subunit alpha; Alpha-NaCH; Epithelial Na(+) channel subunit alpha; Nonvoltage-gated sodium channel 1 subunit alpha; SCNEA